MLSISIGLGNPKSRARFELRLSGGGYGKAADLDDDKAMKLNNTAAWIFGGSLVLAGASNAVGQDQSPLRLAMNLAETQDAVGGGVKSVADGTTLRLRGFGIMSDAEGDLKWGDRISGVTSDLDLEQILGMDLNTCTGGFLIGLNLGSEKRLHLEASYDGFYDYDGDRVIGSISVDGEVYTGEVRSSIELHAGMLNIGYDFLKMDRFTVTGNLGVRIFYVDASIEEVLSGRNESLELWVPIPTPGIAARVNLTDNLYISGSAAGLWLGEYGCYVEASAEIGYDLNRNMGVFVGYRFWALDLEWSDNNLEFQNGHLYAGIEVRI